VRPLLYWKSNNCYIFWVCVCGLRYPACNAHAPYCHLWPVLPYNIFPYYFINGTIFEKKKRLNIKCVFWFSLQLLFGKILRLRSTDRDMIKNLYWSSYKLPVIFVRFDWKLNFLNRFSKNAQTWNVMKIRPVGAEVFHAEGRTDGRTDRQTNRNDKAVSSFSQYC